MRSLCATVLTAAACAPASGSTIIGLGHVHPTNGTQAPFVWTRSRGTLPLHQFQSSAGVDLSGWTLGGATGISADGTRIVGTGLGPAGRPEASMAVLPAPGAAALALVGLPAAARRRRAW